MELTNNETKVLAYLKGRDFTSPTTIGEAVHPSRMYGSPWASPICKKLVSRGLVERNARGWYKLSVGEK